MLDDFDIEVPEEDDSFGDDFGGDFDDFDDDSPPEESSNRTFLLAAGGIGILIILTLCIAIYAIFIAPGGDDNQSANETTFANNTAVALIGTQTAEAAAQATATPTNTMDITATDVPATDTPDAPVTQDPGAGGPTADPRTATVQALLTQASVAQTQAAAAILTVTVTPTASALPDAGFIDDVGAPGLLAMATLLVVVIFVTRRVRTTEG
ncbi:MAG: hypothetical protein DWQ07_19840 [Chloroflexi bacterium]|nr:MAG: hypothetical protein DWQ07_19840 [Chloroflexota bacterium]MBL1194336.1 hypothetical protein [Chloroflexota bacterium]NOH11626.1 hypothetical protein [Chloroflexota bacterium]